VPRVLGVDVESEQVSEKKRRWKDEGKK